MGIKPKDNENKNTIHEPSIISQSKPTNLQQKKKDVEPCLIQDGIDITKNISNDRRSDVKKSEAKSIKKVLSIPKNIQSAHIICSLISDSSFFQGLLCSRQKKPKNPRI